MRSEMQVLRVIGWISLLMGCGGQGDGICEKDHCAAGKSNSGGTTGTTAGTSQASPGSGVTGGNRASLAGGTGGALTNTQQTTSAAAVTGGTTANPTATFSTGGTQSTCFLSHDNVCNFAAVGKLYAPLPDDTSLYAEMTFELCFNGSCGTFVPATLSEFKFGAGGYGAGIAEPARDIKISAYFWFNQLPCKSNCATPKYQLLVEIETSNNSRLNDGDVWSLTVRNADSSTFYTSTTVSSYQSVTTWGSGDFTSCSASCKILPVPIAA